MFTNSAFGNENIAKHCRHIASLRALTWGADSEGIGEGDLDWKASCEMKPESWEEMLERRAGACWGSVELR